MSDKIPKRYQPRGKVAKGAQRALAAPNKATLSGDLRHRVPMRDLLWLHRPADRRAAFRVLEDWYTLLLPLSERPSPAFVAALLTDYFNSDWDKCTGLGAKLIRCDGVVF